MSEQDYKQLSGNNQQYLADTSFMRLRIDSEPILDRIHIFLKGTKKFIVRGKDGQYYEEERRLSDALANDTGVNQIMNKLHTFINPQTVQGNLDTNHYYDLMAEWRGDIKNDLVMNCGEWGIEDTKLEYICNTIMSIVEAFFTRCINNKERESYKETVVSRETISPDYLKKKGALKGLLQ